MISVLIVEDSVVQRAILKRALERDAEFSLAGQARNGKEAVELVEETRPDVVLMDINMPEMDGIEATQVIMQRCPVPIVIVSSTLNKRDVDQSLKAIGAGAVSVIAKPDYAGSAEHQEIAPAMRREIIAASKVKVGRRSSDPVPAAIQASVPTGTASIPVVSAEVIGICSGTGALPDLQRILSALPKPVPLPVLLVQHMWEGLDEGFAPWLSGLTGQPIAIAENGQQLQPGVWLGPAGQHLTLGAGKRIVLLAGEPEEVPCPAGDVLFHSLALHLGSSAAGVLLAGQGKDGAAGLLSILQGGGQTLIQDENSCALWGAPEVASRFGAATHELSPDAIAEALTRMTTGGLTT